MLRTTLALGFVAALVAGGGCDQGPKNSLAKAAASNDAAAVRELLNSGHKADESDDVWTPLIWATRAGAADAMRVLLDAGADVNRPGTSGDDWDATPLQHAVLARQPAAVQLLIERGADVNRSGGAARLAPLFLAAGDTDPTILKMLLAHGADPTVEDEKGETPLTMAIAAGSLHGPDRPMFGGCRVESVRALVTHNPQLRLKRTAAWDDAVWWARLQRCTDVLKMVEG